MRVKFELVDKALYKRERQHLAQADRLGKWVVVPAFLLSLMGPIFIHVYSFITDSPLSFGDVPIFFSIASYVTAYVFYIVLLARASILADSAIRREFDGKQWASLVLSGKSGSQIILSKWWAIFTHTIRSVVFGLLPIVLFYRGDLRPTPSFPSDNFRPAYSLLDLYVPETFSLNRDLYNTPIAMLGPAVGIAVLYALAGFALIISLSFITAFLRRRFNFPRIGGFAARVGVSVVVLASLVAVQAPVQSSLFGYGALGDIGTVDLSNLQESLDKTICYAPSFTCQNGRLLLDQIHQVRAIESVEIGLMTLVDNSGLLIGQSMDELGTEGFPADSAAIGLLVYLGLIATCLRFTVSMSANVALSD